MPSFTIHGLIPLLFLLAVRRLDARKVWILWPLTFAPDLDIVFAGLHRAVLGNLFILAPFAVALAMAWRRENREVVEWMSIALVFLASHLVMDVFTGGSVLFWPITDWNVCYVTGIDVVTATGQLSPYFENCSASGVPVMSEVYPWLNVWEGAILAFVLPAGLVMGAINLVEYVRARRAARPDA